MDRKSPVDAHIGQRLKEYRRLRGMTVRELADAAHVTPGQISHYEHGRDRISHERITEFARILRLNRTISTSRRARGCAAITFAGALRISWQR